MSVTTFLAIYGAVLSTVTVVLAIRTAIEKHRAKTPLLEVIWGLGIYEGKDAVFIKVVNRGERPIALKGWSIQTVRTTLKSKDRLDKPRLRDSTYHPSFVIVSTCSFPSSLESDRSCELTLDAATIVSMIGVGHWDKLIVAFEDESGRLYTAARPMQLKGDRITY